MTTTIADHTIGTGHPTFVIAEAGSNHNLSYTTALELTKAAANAGCDAVKWQLFRADSLYSKRAAPELHAAAKECELPQEWLPQLKRAAGEVGLVFLCSVFCRWGADVLDELDVAAYKIASSAAVDYPFVTYVAKKGSPLIISTGMCGFAEAGLARTNVLRVADYNSADMRLALLHCVSEYPADPNTVNLAAMHRLRSPTVPIGFSDHTLDVDLPAKAVLAGADIVEKHFTLSRDQDGPDHGHSLEPDELERMVQQIREAETLLGSAEKQPTEQEQQNRQLYRRSVVAEEFVAAGQPLPASVLTSKRPGTGIPARDIDRVAGQVAAQDIEADTVLTWDMVGVQEEGA